MKVEDFMVGADTAEFQADEDFDALFGLFKEYDARELEQFRRALNRSLALSEDQRRLLLELLMDTQDRRGWLGDEEFFDDDDD